MQLCTHLTEGRTLCNNDVKFAFPRRVFQESFHRSGAADGHDDLVRVDVFQRLHGDVVCGALWKSQAYLALQSYIQSYISQSLAEASMGSHPVLSAVR